MVTHLRVHLSVQRTFKNIVIKLFLVLQTVIKKDFVIMDFVIVKMDNPVLIVAYLVQLIK